MLFNKGKIVLKSFLYFFGAIFLAACIYAFIQSVPISYEVDVQQSQIVTEQVGAKTQGPLKSAIDKKSTVLCEIESFWSKYNVWGDTDKVYTSTENDGADEKEVNGNNGCEQPFDDAVSE